MTESRQREKTDEMSRVLHNIMDGIGHVYFSPPNKLEYPCILYQIARRTSKHADDVRYIDRIQFTVTAITRDPNSDIPYKIMDSFDYVSHDNNFISERLYHDVFTVYL